MVKSGLLDVVVSMERWQSKAANGVKQGTQDHSRPEGIHGGVNACHHLHLLS
jgi:hypothetical protein